MFIFIALLLNKSTQEGIHCSKILENDTFVESQDTTISGLSTSGTRNRLGLVK